MSDTDFSYPAVSNMSVKYEVLGVEVHRNSCFSTMDNISVTGLCIGGDMFKYNKTAFIWYGWHTTSASVESNHTIR